MAIDSRFRLVGYRFSRLVLDESPVERAKQESVALQISTTADEPTISVLKFGARKVIELSVSVKVRIAEQSKAKRELKSLDIVCARAIAGFVGRDKADDGNLEAFHADTKDYARSVYWLLRQRVQSLTSLTLLRELVFPLEPSDIINDGGVEATPRKKISTAKRVRNSPKRGEKP